MPAAASLQPHSHLHPQPHRAGCGLCALRSRRLFTGLLVAGGVAALAGPARAQDSTRLGVQADVGRNSRFTQFVSADQMEGAAAQQYQKMLREAAAQRALAPAAHPQVVRLRAIAQRIIAHAAPWNGRTSQWRWEVNLLGSKDLNAFCMPGGKIAFYFGILQKLQLTDDEVAAIMGHEVAHALREHARERMGKTLATRGAIEVGAAIFGLGNAARMAVDMGGQLLTLKFSRNDETEADLVGMELAARAGYDPAAGVTLWHKMTAASRGAPPQWISTHPAGETRIKEIQGKLARVQPLFLSAGKPTQRYAPPAA
jgi:predicted Zn-dependent protease